MEPREIHIVYGKKEWFFPIEDILFVKAAGNYSEVYLSNTDYTPRIQLGKFWDEIEIQAKGYPHHLERVARSYIINLDYLTNVDPQEGSITLYKPDSPIQDKVLEKGASKPTLSEEIMKHVKAIDSIKNQNKVFEKKELKVNIGKDPTKELIKYLNKNKRKEVLGAYAIMKELKVPVDELNDEHLMEAGYEYVNLGLTSGTLWATHNLNGRAYFAWGELYESDSYDKKEYIHKNILDSLYNIVDPNTSALSLKYDAARYLRGGGWRIPTKKECEELINECIPCWCITQDKKYGCLLTGPNGNHIFLPAYGYRQGHSMMRNEDLCTFWSSSNSEFNRPVTFDFFEYEDEELELDRFLSNKDPYCGLPIRPVISKGGLTKEEGNLKRMLIIKDFFENDEDEIMHGFNSVMDGWIIERITPPVEPEDAKSVLGNILKNFNPNVVVTFKSSCFWGQVIKGRIKFFVEPAWKMSESMKNYMDVEQDGQEKEGWPITIEMIDYYKCKEEELAKKELGNNCWILAEEPWDIDDPQFKDCPSVEVLPTEALDSWTVARLLPIIKEIIEGHYQDENGKRTPYGEKFNI